MRTSAISLLVLSAYQGEPVEPKNSDGSYTLLYPNSDLIVLTQNENSSSAISTNQDVDADLNNQNAGNDQQNEVGECTPYINQQECL